MQLKYDNGNKEVKCPCGKPEIMHGCGSFLFFYMKSSIFFPEIIKKLALCGGLCYIQLQVIRNKRDIL